MPTFVALLRSINVGKAKRVPMAELRALLSGLGYKGVGTLLNRGNAVFRAPRGTPAKHATEIAAAISTQLKVEVPVIVKSASELAASFPRTQSRRERKSIHAFWSRSFKTPRHCQASQSSSRSWCLLSSSR